MRLGNAFRNRFGMILVIVSGISLLVLILLDHSNSLLLRDLNMLQDPPLDNVSSLQTSEKTHVYLSGLFEDLFEKAAPDDLMELTRSIGAARIKESIQLISSETEVYYWLIISNVFLIGLSFSFFFLKRQRRKFTVKSKYYRKEIQRLRQFQNIYEGSLLEAKKSHGKLQEAYRKLKVKEGDLLTKIQESEALQKEMKHFVDVQISTNEQLMIAEGKLKKLLEQEKESKSIITQTLDKLKETQGQLVHSEKMASLGQLTAGIAHEINNPINFIYNGLESLKRNTKDLFQVLDKYQELEHVADTAKVLEEVHTLKEELEYEEIQQDLEEMLSDIKDGAVRTIEIVRGLRVFSRLDEENRKLANVNDCLDATLILLKNKTKNRINVVKDYADELPEIMCYPGQLNQVFMNILNNAIQAIPEEKRDAEITIGTKVTGEELLVTLQDNGSGMSDDVKQRIFEPFFTTKPVGVGTGLGMSISYGIIEKHHGSIQLESTVGLGTTFSIHLPLVSDVDADSQVYSKAV